MAYGFYLRKNRRKFRKVAVQSKTPVVATYKYPKKYIKSSKKTSFAQRVNQIVSRNVENKQTPSVNNTQRVCTLIGGTPSWFLINNWDTFLYTIPQGVAEQQRVGNQIKLKRWVIRGQIHPDPVFYNPVNSTTIGNSTTGYIDLYFGRLNSNEEVTSDLPKFLDNGSSSVNPTGAQNQIFKPINKDLYKIYYHKRFKMSPSTGASANGGVGGLQPTQLMYANNDFNLVRTFGFDVTKYICKNAVIKFDDASQQPQNSMIRQLALWATWTPAMGDMGQALSGQINHFYEISTCSYAEYEDA